MKKLVSLVLCLCMIIGITACTKVEPQGDLWETATYTENIELGEGEKQFLLDVVAGEKTVTFTINTNKETVGDALLEHNLIAGEKGPYGLYVKFVNGIEADYDKTQSYWGFNKNGEGLLTGVDGEEIEDGAHYELVYTEA